MPAHRVLVDECVDPGVIEHLRRSGFDVTRVPRAGKPDSPQDEDVLALAAAEQRVVITTDLSDYYRLDAEYRRTGRKHYGIVIGHPGWSTSRLCHAFESTLRHTPETALHNTVVWAATVPAEP